MFYVNKKNIYFLMRQAILKVTRSMDGMVFKPENESTLISRAGFDRCDRYELCSICSIALILKKHKNVETPLLKD